jgi:hypothetical protein
MSQKFEDFELVLNDKFTITGQMRWLQNKFSKMPRGQIELAIS